MTQKNKEITIAYGNEIQLTTTGEKNSQVFLKLSPAFRNKQLKELKGSALSVFICYALHSNNQGYTWIDTETIQRETGFNRIDKARKILIKKGYLYQERLFNKEGLLRDYIYRIFQPIEYREFKIRGEILSPSRKKTDTAESACQALNEGIIEEEPPVIEEEPSLSPKKATNIIHLEVVELFVYYKEQFQKKISDKAPLFNWAQCEKLSRSYIKELGLEKMKELMDKYLDSNDKLYKENAYSLSCFLSSKILHRLNQSK